MIWTVIVSVGAFASVMLYVVYEFSNHKPKKLSDK